MNDWRLKTSAHMSRFLAELLRSHFLHLAISTIVRFGVTGYLLLWTIRGADAHLLSIV
jgi:hypothetical protein